MKPWWLTTTVDLRKQVGRSTSPYLEMARQLNAILNHFEAGDTSVYDAQDIAAFKRIVEKIMQELQMLSH